MAILFSDIQFLGSVGNLSAYRMKGSDKIILRKKGGGSRKKIKTSPSCERIRKINMEFGGRSAVTKLIRRALGPVRLLADFNFTGHLHKILQPIQADDRINKTGERSVPLTRNPKLLEGFSLNRNRTFESVIRTPVSYSLDKDTRSATLTIPALSLIVRHVIVYRPVPNTRAEDERMMIILRNTGTYLKGKFIRICANMPPVAVNCRGVKSGILFP